MNRDIFKKKVSDSLSEIINQDLEIDILTNKINMINMYCKLEILLYYDNNVSFTEIANNTVQIIKYLNTNDKLLLLHLTIINGLNNMLFYPRINNIMSFHDIEIWLKKFTDIYHI